MSRNTGFSVVALRPSVRVVAGSSSRVLTISTIESVQHFVDEMSIKPQSGTGIQDLIIRLSGLPTFQDAHILSIHAHLQLVPPLTDLTLLLPPTTPSDLLLDVNFGGLQFFKSNLPHAVLAAFLACHQSVSILVLGPCGPGRRCPLLEVDLTHVTELECDAECAQSLAHGDLFRLTISKSADGPRIGAVFRALRVCTSGLYSLTIDFFPDDVDVLDNISRFAPFLRKLKLLEQSGAPVRGGRSGRRAFNDTLTWARALRKLRFLEELSLQTSARLVRQPGDYRLERSLVLGWVYSVRARTFRRLPTSSKAHPSLYHVRIWYGARSNDPALSKWFKDGEDWRRLGQPIVGQDLDDIDF